MTTDEIFLDEEGNPIGQVVMADEALVPMPDGSVQRAETALVEDKTAELGTDLDFYPGYLDDEKRTVARRLYIQERYTIERIADTVGVPQRTVSMWLYHEKWDGVIAKEVEARRRDAVVRNAESKLDLAALRAERRLDAAKRQLAVTDKVIDAAEAALDDGGASIKSVAEAVASASKIQQTILGVSESGTVVDDEASDESKKKKAEGGNKQALVVVFPSEMPPIRRVR